MATFSASRETAHDFTVPVARIGNLRRLGLSDPEIHRIVAPRRTLSRRSQQGDMLSVAESDRVRRVERIWELGTRVFAGEEKFARWMRKENRALGDARPIELLQTETGAHVVEEELHRIDFGLFA
jgi:putative toxin-antitoxin system antitoxin component (TIGR02293 family)